MITTTPRRTLNFVSVYTGLFSHEDAIAYEGALFFYMTFFQATAICKQAPDTYLEPGKTSKMERLQK